MKQLLAGVLAVMLAAPIGIGCSARKTEQIPVPPAKTGGSLALAVNPSEGMSKDDTSFLQDTLRRKFEEAGYGPVSLTKKRGKAETELIVTMEKYEEVNKKDTGCVVVSGSCTYLCPCAAPCFVAPRYFDVRFELVAGVSAYRKGRHLFTERFSGIGGASTNVIDAGAEKMKKSLKEIAINNAVAGIVEKINGK